MQSLYRHSTAKIFFALVLVAIFTRQILAQPCKATDSNCAIYLAKPPIDWSTVSLPPAPSIAGDLALGSDRPGMLGAITFRGNKAVCIGLMRRGGCN